MAWRCSGISNSKLIDNLFAAGIINKDRIRQAMLRVDRAYFVPSHLSELAYVDAPQSIGYSATISAPHMHAYALDYLEPYLQPGHHVLDVGSGSGYLCACFSELVGNNGRVTGIEHIPELVEMSIENLKRWNKITLESGNVQCLLGDGRKGYLPAAPYNAIHVGAAAKEEVLETLLSQLTSPGRLIIPVEIRDGDQIFMQLDKDELGNVHKKSLMGVRYVALTDSEAQIRSCY
ncbi:hypothetical protein HMI54_004607 [Coelomomyces lativittatus]|nr:hypothetical protein HMI56_001664 [Coelomomyces lativittatus]KAJ1506991.1 hypothetical protein HMI54_004607 [Coelomomyces lativittatus]